MSNRPFVCSPAGSKSITNRAVVLAGMSRKQTIIKNFLVSDDTLVGLENLKKLGFTVYTMFDSPNQINEVTISPPDFDVLSKCNFYDQTFDLNMGNAGTMARFFSAVVLNWTKTFPESKPICVRFDANEQLRKRPITPFIKALKELNASILGDTYPYTMRSSDLSGEVEICTEQSSQFLSGLLLAAAGSMNSIQIKRIAHLPQADYVFMTIDCLKKFNFSVSTAQDLKEFLVSSRDHQSIFCDEFFVEPDASTACYFLALAFIHNFSLVIDGLGSSSLQPDVQFCDFLQRMGAYIELESHKIIVHKRESQSIKGGFTYDFSMMSDQALTAGVLGLFADDKIEITGVGHIRHHESDRILCLVKNFQKLGLTIFEKADGFIVPRQGGSLTKIKGIWNTHHDHRFAMSGFLLTSINPDITIENPKCTSKTSPTFFVDAARALAFSFRNEYNQSNCRIDS